MATKSSPEELAMLTAKVPADFMAAITAEAARRGVSRSQAVREALAAWLDTEAVPA
jgi:plasmid stability protein